MFPWNPSQWSEQYLLTLIGQPESGRLEFKSGKGLAKKEDKDKFVRDQLSPAVSAFANSEGGILVIGMDEDRATKPRIANQLDGITAGAGNAIESPEQFQQLVDSCISPFLPGLAARRVALSGQLQGRVALVVYVPQGNTAYQARDHLYYSRSEFETKGPKRDFDEYEFKLAVGNTGELTIRDFVLSVRVLNVDGGSTLVGEQSPAIGVESRFRVTRVEGAVGPGPRPEKKLFPTDRLPFPEQTWLLRIASVGGLLAESLAIEWTIYLDDTAPNRGTINLGLALDETRHVEDAS